MSETAMKMYLLASVERMAIFDYFYETLKSTVKGNVEITPDDALLLLSHHIFMMPKLKKIMEIDNPKDPMTALLDRTINALRAT